MDQPTDEVSADDGTDNDAQPADPQSGRPPSPAPTRTNGPFPFTFTTTETTYDMSGGFNPYRVLAGDLDEGNDVYGYLTFDFPVTAADLTVLATAEGPLHQIDTSDPSV